MLNFEELDADITFEDQMMVDDGPIVLMNLFTVSEADEEALLKAWSDDAGFMKTQPGYISTQLHKGIGGSSTFMNYAIWQDVQSFRNAFSQPEFQRRISNYPASAIAKPHLCKKLKIDNHCVG